MAGKFFSSLERNFPLYETPSELMKFRMELIRRFHAVKLRVACGCRLLEDRFVRRDVILFYLASKCRQRDAQKLCSPAFVPAGNGEHFTDVLPFSMREG